MIYQTEIRGFSNTFIFIIIYCTLTRHRIDSCSSTPNSCERVDSSPCSLFLRHEFLLKIWKAGNFADKRLPTCVPATGLRVDSLAFPPRHEGEENHNSDSRLNYITWPESSSGLFSAGLLSRQWSKATCGTRIRSSPVTYSDHHIGHHSESPCLNGPETNKRVCRRTSL